MADAIGSLAAGLQDVSGSAGAGDAPYNLLLKDIFDGMNDFDHGVQQTAAAALVQVSFARRSISDVDIGG